MLRQILAVSAAAALFASTAQAADLIIADEPAAIEASAFDWEGFYAGVQAGGQFYPGLSYGLLGVHAGVNFLPAEGFLLGLEGTAEVIWGDPGTFGEFFVSGRAGALITDDVLLYGLAGVGVEVNEAGDTFGSYQLGGGVEVAVAESISLRGQLVGVGFVDSSDFFDGAKATIGVSFHF